MANSPEIEDLEQKLLYDVELIERVRDRFGINTLIHGMEERKKIDMSARLIITNYLKGNDTGKKDVEDALKARVLAGISFYYDMDYMEAGLCFRQATSAAFKLGHYYETIELGESAIAANNNARKFLRDIKGFLAHNMKELVENSPRVYDAYLSNLEFFRRLGGHGRITRENRGCCSLIAKAHIELSKIERSSHLKEARHYLIQLGDSCAHENISPYNNRLFMDALESYAMATAMQIRGIPYDMLRQRIINPHLNR